MLHSLRSVLCCGGIVLSAFVGMAGAQGDEPKSPSSAGPKPAAAAPRRPTREELEKQFSEQLSGATFAGQFSVAGQKEGAAPHMERYTLARVSKVSGDTWQFEARMQYGQLDVTLPLRLEVKWADDTPVISLTDLTIPGMGTFTSRVLVYGDRYAGTWQHGKAGGHLWGRIEKGPAKQPTTPATPSPASRTTPSK